MVEMIVAHRLDAEAVELAMRFRHGSDVLTRKIQVLFFLVEVRSAYYGYFVNQTPGLVACCDSAPRIVGTNCLEGLQRMLPGLEVRLCMTR